MEMVKIRTIKGRIITLNILKRTSYQLVGKDKFNKDVIVPFSEIDFMFPVDGGANE